jgi:small-conductance mechanosensitive channel
MAKKTKNDVDDLVARIIKKIDWFFYLFLSLYIASKFLFFPQIIVTALDYSTLIVLTFYVIKSLQEISNYSIDKIKQKRIKENKNADVTTLDFIKKVIQYSLWVLAIILVLSNLGYDVSALLAGFGIGGIAIAFALQNILTDVFASFSIYFDKPFEVGDYIVFGENSGTVKKIGIKSTRITALKGQEIVISNKKLTETILHNYRKMKRRRIGFELIVDNNTSTKKLEKIPQIIKDIVNNIGSAEFDRAFFREFGDYGLVFDIVYYVKSKKYSKYIDVHQKINLEIKKRFEKEKINMPYPRSTVFVKKINKNY